MWLHSGAADVDAPVSGTLTCTVASGEPTEARASLLLSSVATSAKRAAGKAAAVKAAQRGRTVLQALATPRRLRFEFRLWQRDEQSSWVTPAQEGVSCPFCGLDCPNDM